MALFLQHKHIYAAFHKNTLYSFFDCYDTVKLHNSNDNLMKIFNEKLKNKTVVSLWKTMFLIFFKILSQSKKQLFLKQASS